MFYPESFLSISFNERRVQKVVKFNKRRGAYTNKCDIGLKRLFYSYLDVDKLLKSPFYAKFKFRKINFIFR